VNLHKDGTIGKVAAGASRSELFSELPKGSMGSSIRFDRSGRMFVADFKKHNVFLFEPGEKVPSVYFQSNQFNQPNDLAIAPDGTLYASDPNFGKGAGQIWRITRGPDGKGRGEVMFSDRKMGVTNGIDLSPDGQALYISESATRELWAYCLQGVKLTAARLVKKFDGPPKSELDGLRTDIDGKIFVTWPGTGSVAVLTPDGNLAEQPHLWWARWKDGLRHAS